MIWMLKSLIRGKFIGSRSVNNPPEHFVNNQVLTVVFTPALREQVQTLLAEMHALYARGYTPKVKPTKSCNACSLKELCLPRLMKVKSVSAYLKSAMAMEDTP